MPRSVATELVYELISKLMVNAGYERLSPDHLADLMDQTKPEDRPESVRLASNLAVTLVGEIVS